MTGAQNHYYPRGLEVAAHFKGSEGIWAFYPDGTVFIFVHGFAGGATATWNMFPGLLFEDEEFIDSDIVFLGYDSMKVQARINASRLHQFLKQLAEHPLQVINATLPGKFAREEPFAYKKIFLVAHSLGAVLCRQALLDAYKNKESWASRTHLVLFAPAHMGSRLPALLKETLYEFFPTKVLKLLITFHYQVLHDLEQDSQFLKMLRENSERLLPIAPTLPARHIVHASNDHVVVVNDFLFADPSPIIVEDKGHSKVCKPDRNFLQSIPVLVEIPKRLRCRHHATATPFDFSVLPISVCRAARNNGRWR